MGSSLKVSVWRLAALSLSISSSLFSVEECGPSEKPLRIELRHIEGNGVGYNTGYTTLDFFAAPNNDRFVPFLDLRGHVFDDGRWAANAGVGLRYLASRIWGVNAYYDYRQTEHFHYNQLSVGLESLGRWLDFRINGYLPVGAKFSPFYRTKFDHFEGHEMILSRTQEFAMKGANAEMGVHIYKGYPVKLYGAIGPYYFERSGENAWGGKSRLAAVFYDYLRAEVSGSYDTVFRWIGQGQIGLQFQLGPRRALKKKPDNICSKQLMLNELSHQRVDRNEIIVVDHRHVKSTAIDPLTGLPYVFWFVNNTSSSLGTFESPFPTLLLAQNASSSYDVIYVFEGDGTSKGMNAGITLKNFQLFLGSGKQQPINTTAGPVTIPALTSGVPLVTHPAGNIVTLSNNNQVSGFHFDGGTSAIFGSTINNVSIMQNDFTTAVVQSSVNLTDVGGQISASNNTFSTSVVDQNANGILITNTNASAAIAVKNNTFNNHGGSGVYVLGMGNSSQVVTVRNNLFIAPIGFEGDQTLPGFLLGPYGVRVEGMNTAMLEANVSNNTYLYHELQGIAMQTVNSAHITSVVNGNQITPGTLVPITGGNPSAGILSESLDSSTQQFTAIGNTVGASKTAGIGFASVSPGDSTGLIAANTVSQGGQSPGTTFFGGGILVASEGAGSVKAQVENNILIQNFLEGGVLALSLDPTATIIPGPLCLGLHNNQSDTGYTLYSINTGAGVPIIDLENGYQSNVGLINGVPPNSSSIPPSGPRPPFFIPGGPITIVPFGFCE